MTLDGRVIDVLKTATRPGLAGDPDLSLVGLIDITERVRAQEMLQRVQADFAHAARVSMLGELTASIAHEVNQPLAAIAINGEVVLRLLGRPEPDMGEVREMAACVVNDARRAADYAGPHDLIWRLIHLRDRKTGETLPRHEVRDEAASVIAGGVSPTVRALTWIWYLLALNPVVEERLHAEIDAVLRGGPLVPSQLAQLNYTRQVLDETMRLYPPIPAILREARAADTLCGHPVPPRSVIAILPWVVHRHRRLWSEPEHFDPDRFTPENAAARPRFAYVPFAGGPRICVGASFAMTQMLIVVAMLARRFRFRLVPEHPIRPVGRISLHPFGGLRVRVERRETASADALNASLP